MSPANSNPPARFNVLCLGCGRQIAAASEWIGQEVRCPHCSATMTVLPPASSGRPVRAGLPRVAAGRRFNFACPRCESMLESAIDMSDQTGHCPTCGARFLIPDTGRGAKLVDGDDQDPTPMHAYAASGHQAPRIIRLPGGKIAIECPRCKTQSDIAADNCGCCGTPFTIEGVPAPAAAGEDALGTAALVIGIISIVLCPLIVPAVVAGVLGVASWLRSYGRRPSTQALAAIVLAAVALALGAYWWL